MKGQYEVSYIRAQDGDSMERVITAGSPDEAVCILYGQLAGWAKDIQDVAKSTEILGVELLGVIDDSGSFISDCRKVPENGKPRLHAGVIVDESALDPGRYRESAF